MASGPAPAAAVGRGRLGRPVFACMDGLRAVAAFAVLFHHVGFDTGTTFRTRVVGDLVARGDIGVPIFFAISGFLLYRPFAAARRHGSPAPVTASFWWRRALRIFPAYWLALVVLVVVTSEHVDGVGQWAQYLTLTQAYRSETALGALPHTWSLCAELAFYAVLPAYAWLIARAGTRWSSAPWVGVGALVAASFGYHAVLEVTDPSWKAVGLLWMPAHLEMFAIGIALAELSVVAGTMPRLGRRLDRWGQPDLAWFGLAVAAYATVSLVLDLPKGLEPFSGRQLFARQVLYGLVTAGLLVPAVFGDADRGPVRRALRWRPIVWTGLVSYGVYLWHKSLSIEVVELTGGDHDALDGNFVLVAVVLVAVTLAIAGLSRRFWEEPIARRWSARFDRV